MPNAAGSTPGDERPESWTRAAAAAVGVFYLLNGGWAMLAPASFYERVAAFPPDNPHFLRDTGAFTIGLGLAALAAAAQRARGAAAMGAVAVASALHLLAHVVDIDAGGFPVRDLVVLGAVTAAAASAAWGMRRAG